MMFSKACEYGIRAMIFMAKEGKNGKVQRINSIAQEIDSPPSFTAKVLQLLVKGGLLESSKGAHGGFWLNPSRVPNISLKEIVQCIDGEAIYQGCGLGLKECSEKLPCPLHDSFKKIRDELKEMLESTTLIDLAQKLDTHQALLKRLP